MKYIIPVIFAILIVISLTQIDLGTSLILIIVFAVIAISEIKTGSAVVCKECGYQGSSKRKVKGSLLMEIILWCLFIIPGLIYSIWRFTSAHSVCASCGKDSIIPENSPLGLKLTASNNKEKTENISLDN